MRYTVRVSVVFILLFPSLLFAQLNTTHWRKQIDKSDSSDNRLNHKIDSVQGKINNALNPNFNQIAKTTLSKNKVKRDSIRFYKQRDKEKKRVQAKLDKAMKDNLPTGRYATQLDSLNKLKYNKDNGPSNPKKSTIRQKFADKRDSLNNVVHDNGYKTKLDSVTGKPTNEVRKIQSKISNAEQKVNAPVNQVEDKVNEKLTLMNKEGGTGANLPGNVTVPDAGVKTDLNVQGKFGTDIKNPIGEQTQQLQQAAKPINDLKQLPSEQMDKVKSIGEVKEAQQKLGAANSITDKAQAYSSDAKNIASGNLNEVKGAPKALEEKVSSMDGLSDLKKESSQLDQYKELAGKGNDPEALRQLAMQQAQESFKPPVNHFAGQEKVLQQAMDNMAKLKTKYVELNSLKDIPKGTPNEMKGKPFIERIVPGITLQVQKSKDVLIDYNPYLGYRISGKLTAGAGWNERFNIGKHFHFSLRDRIYGPRVFADLKLWKGFSVRTDIEKMNTYVPSVVSLSDPSYRAWVWSAFIGIKKEYKFWGNVKGNAQFLYNLYDDHDNSPYADRFAVRMGFEFPMKKKSTN